MALIPFLFSKRLHMHLTTDELNSIPCHYPLNPQKQMGSSICCQDRFSISRKLHCFFSSCAIPPALAFLFLAILFFPQTGFTVSTPVEYRTVQVESGRVREAPGLDAPVEFGILEGEIYPVLEIRGNWYRIRKPDGRTGWAHASLFAGPTLPKKETDAQEEKADSLTSPVSPEKEEVPASEEEKAPSGQSISDATFTDNRKRLTTAAQVGRVRKDASADSEIAFILKKGDAVYLIETKPEGWLHVGLPDGRKGWARNSVFEDAPVAEPSDHPVELPQKTVTVSNGRVRKEPSLNGEIIATLTTGDKVSVLKTTSPWNQIILQDGRMGWAHDILFRETLEDTTEPEPAIYPGNSRLRVDVDSAIIRTAPTTEAGILSGASKGDTLLAVEKSGDWYKVQIASGSTGWAHKSLFAGDDAFLQKPGDPDSEKRIHSIDLDLNDAGEERVVFSLTGFYPPETFVIEEKTPKVVCDFKGVRPSSEISSSIDVNGNMIRQIRTGMHPGEDKFRVVMDLVPEKNYVVEQIYYKKEKLYVLIFKPPQMPGVQ